MSISKERFHELTDEALSDGLLVAFDGCHKLYIALDETEAEWFRDEYPHVCEGSLNQMADQMWDWWTESCSLRFINSVRHNAENPNAGFTTVIGQFAEEDEED